MNKIKEELNQLFKKRELILEQLKITHDQLKVVDELINKLVLETNKSCLLITDN